MDTSLCLRVPGFTVSHVKAGIKKSDTAAGDMGLIWSETPVPAACVFTSSTAAAAPVVLSREHIKNGLAQAVLINSGNANACTGGEGENNCRILGKALAEKLGISEENILHTSTGVIGHQLPMDKMTGALDALADSRNESRGFGLAETIMTTDLVPKWTCVQGYIDGKKVTISGIAKGSGMIAPHMATMLSYVLTDAAVSVQVLSDIWKQVTEETFNRVTVDTDTSTNDTAVIMASGKAGNNTITDSDHPDYNRFITLLKAAVRPLAKQIAADGEGATKLVTVDASGFGSAAECRKVARTVAESPLVKTAMFGCDPNWGRIIAAVGRSGTKLGPSDVCISLCGVPVLIFGTPAEFDPEKLSEQMKASEVMVEITGTNGSESGRIYTCDYSYDYIRINAEYHT